MTVKTKSKTHQELSPIRAYIELRLQTEIKAASKQINVLFKIAAINKHHVFLQLCLSFEKGKTAKTDSLATASQTFSQHCCG